MPVTANGQAETFAEGIQKVGDGFSLRAGLESIATLDTAMACHKPGMAQLFENVGHEWTTQLKLVRDGTGIIPLAASGQRPEDEQGIVNFAAQQWHPITLIPVTLGRPRNGTRLLPFPFVADSTEQTSAKIA
jgi:hypothetical protein